MKIQLRKGLGNSGKRGGGKSGWRKLTLLRGTFQHFKPMGMGGRNNASLSGYIERVSGAKIAIGLDVH